MSLRASDEDRPAALVGPLPFLRMGEPLCIEMPGAPADATARSAHIAGVSLEVEDDGVPRLVVELSRRAPGRPAGGAPSLRGTTLETVVLVLGCATLALAAFLAGWAL
jgi:hypothetical protein